MVPMIDIKPVLRKERAWILCWCLQIVAGSVGLLRGGGGMASGAIRKRLALSILRGLIVHLGRIGKKVLGFAGVLWKKISFWC